MDNTITDGVSTWARFSVDAITNEVIQWEVVRPGKIQERARYRKAEITPEDLAWARRKINSLPATTDDPRG